MKICKEPSTIIPFFHNRTMNWEAILNIQKKWYSLFDKKYNSKLRSKLRTNEFSIICSNCIGGVIYNRLGVQFQSPTINQFMTDKDFMKFVCNLEHYLNADLIETTGDGAHPCGLLDDIPIIFTHYNTAKEAIDAWNRRKKRINFNKLYIILFDTIDSEITKSDILEFGKLNCANRIVLSKNTYPDIDYVFTIPTKKRDKNRHYMSKNIIGRRRYEGKWDFVKWINDGV